MDIMNSILSIGASLALLLAVFFSYKLSSETKHEKYWVLMSIGLFVFALHHWLMTHYQWSFISQELIELFEYWSSIVGGILVAYSSYGLYKSMRQVKKKLE